MGRINLTIGRIDSFVCPQGKTQAFMWDEEASGLALRATSNGAKAFIFQAKLAGRDLRMTIGSPAAWSIKEARAEARRLQVLVDQGRDPRLEKAAQVQRDRAERRAKQLAQARDSVTFEEAWLVYLEARKKKWSPRTYLDHKRLAAKGGEARKRGQGLTVAGPIASLLTVRLTELTAERLSRWLEAEGAVRPSNAAHAYRLVRAFVRWCADRAEYVQLTDAGIFSSRTVREAVPETKAKEGDALQREQLAPWFAAVRQLPNQVISAYLQALLLTGARREEMAALQWKDVDFEWQTLTIRDKVEGQRTIPLTPYVSACLHALPRRNGWVFSSPTAKDGKLAEPRKAHNQALRSAKLPHVSVHGLRRSFGTLAEWVEVPAGIVAQIQGHKPSAIAEKHYRRRPVDLLRMWHEKVEVWMLGQAGVKLPRTLAKRAGAAAPRGTETADNR